MGGIKIIIGLAFRIRFKLHHAAAQTQSADEDIPAFGVPSHLAVFGHGHQLGFIIWIGRSVAIIIPQREKWFVDVQRTHEDLFLHDIELIGIHFQGTNAAGHVLPHPAITIQEGSVFEVHFFEEEGDVWVRCLLVWIRRREGVNNELVIPYRVFSVEVDDGVFQTKIFEFNFVFQEEPIRHLGLQFPRKKQGIFFLVADQRPFQVQFIEKLDGDAVYFDFRIQVPGEPLGHLPDDEVLAPIGLYEQQSDEDQQQQGEDNAGGYFKRSFQGENLGEISSLGANTKLS